jgi:hypothetical protein
MKDLEEKALKMFPKVDMSKITDGNDISGVARFGFIAGYSEAMKEQRHLFVEYAGFYYRVADFSNEFGVQWVHIYDEPPSLHIDRVKFSSTTGIKLISFTEQEQSTKEDNGY